MTEDPRQVRTRAALEAALVRLTADADVTTISVAALCKEAGVHRTTFYGHATSLEEFAVDVLSRDVDAITSVEFDPANPIPAYKAAMVSLLEHLRGRRTVLRPLFASPWAGALRSKMESYLLQRVNIALDAFATIENVEVPEQRSEVAAYIAGGLVGTVVEWVNSDDVDVDDRADRTQALMPVWWPVK